MQILECELMEKLGRAQNAIPVIVKLKDAHLFPHQKQYPLKPEFKEGLKSIIEKLKEQGGVINSLWQYMQHSLFWV